MRVIVSDTSPIRYLVLIGEEYLLERLYSRILVPLAVYEELQQPATPDVGRKEHLDPAVAQTFIEELM